MPLEVRGHVCKFLRPLLRRETLSNGGSDGNGLARVLFPFSANFYTLPLGIVRELMGHRRRFCLLREDPKWQVRGVGGGVDSFHQFQPCRLAVGFEFRKPFLHNRDHRRCVYLFSGWFRGCDGNTVVKGGLLFANFGNFSQLSISMEG